MPREVFWAGSAMRSREGGDEEETGTHVYMVCTFRSCEFGCAWAGTFANRQAADSILLANTVMNPFFPPQCDKLMMRVAHVVT
mmetsp:Transcript_54374/g.90218  ORF Transcript_54374/g.90218 Transcript_54374/m.90218 type:complete len:83 (-) Transcript_54374:32-280(-)